jgi:hypothetical protein
MHSGIQGSRAVGSMSFVIARCFGTQPFLSSCLACSVQMSGFLFLFKEQMKDRSEVLLVAL